VLFIGKDTLAEDLSFGSDKEGKRRYAISCTGPTRLLVTRDFMANKQQNDLQEPKVGYPFLNCPLMNRKPLRR
jgi:hypothetical protein